MRAPLGGSPCGEGHDRCGPLARVIVATAGVSLRRSRTPRLLALQLLEFAVDRAQTDLPPTIFSDPSVKEGISLFFAL
jgi:hypothetical protein